jgi:hypothetical protein
MGTQPVSKVSVAFDGMVDCLVGKIEKNI